MGSVRIFALSWGDPPASTVGDKLMRFPWFFGVVRGEGEARIMPLLNFLAGRGDESGLPIGVLVRDGGRIITGVTPLVPLTGEEIPVLDYTLLDDTRYWPGGDPHRPGLPIRLPLFV
uniref:Uncharacterized protein n=1 Tax=Candidatus Kentrum sp. TC TaxID=2126339 RepID=A0A450ZB03_9GAMM|nr:MAG: hypothetical protein BECKTC1821D_GA0114238_11276 [Candidatus Kentron sp. TC]